MKRLIIYGAEMSGICAALKYKNYSNGEIEIVIISPTPSIRAGGTATVSALNCWDVRWYNYKNTQGSLRDDLDNLCQQGTFRQLYDYYEAFTNNHTANYRGQWYKTNTDSEFVPSQSESKEDFGDYLTNDLLNGIYFIPKMDIWDVDSCGDDVITVNKLYLRSIYRDSDGYIKWGRQTKVISGDWFIDASDDGKLTSFLTPVTTGRYDWPATYTKQSPENETEDILESCETTDYPIARQQSATLYFRTDNIAYYSAYHANYNGAPWGQSADALDYRDSNKDIYKYNLSRYDSNHMIKNYNMGRNGSNSDEHWTNMLLLFNVDGRAHYRDRISKFYPKAMLSDTEERDDAWIRGNNIINETETDVNNNQFNPVEKAIKSLTGIGSGASLVRNQNKVVVADQLYIRETVHLPLNDCCIDNGTENNYAFGREDVINEESQTNNPVDPYKTRIGLGYYNLDIHTYVKTNAIRKSNDQLTFASDLLIWTRPDLKTSTNNGTGDKAIHEPKYLPYEAIYSSKFNNMLVAGNASSISSLAWAEMRVLPNMCVLGDAAGLILAYCDNNNRTLANIKTEIVDNGSTLSPLHSFMQNANVRIKRYLNDN